MDKIPPPPPPRRPKQTFASRNVVALTMIPTIIAFHYGWYLMQQNRTLVSEKEQIDLPVVTFAKYCYRRLTEEGPGTSTADSQAQTMTK